MDTFRNQPQQAHDALPMETVAFNFEEIKVTYADPHDDKWIPILSWPMPMPRP